MSVNSYIIALMPDKELASKSIAASTDLIPSGDTKFALSDGAAQPHTSLYWPRLDSSSLDTALQEIAKVAQSASVINLTAAKYSLSRNYLDVEYKKTQQIKDLQMQVINAVNPLRPKDKHSLKGVTGRARHNLEQYGWENVGDLMRPHITFTRFKNKDVLPDNLPDPSFFSGDFTQLGVYEQGKHGTCVNEVSTFGLG